ncbi:MAG: metallophosphoesterase [Lacipirellulaceae bacterium]
MRLSNAAFLFAVPLLALGAPRLAAGLADPVSPGSWTLAVLPDTQIYAESYPQHFDAQTNWLVANKASHDLRYVLHEGDITNRNTAVQWDNAKASMSILDGEVPYAMVGGNHDYGPGGNAVDRNSLFNAPGYFGPGSPYASQPSVGGFYESGKTDNSYHTFQAGNRDWLVLALEFGPRNQVVDWANQVVTQHPEHLVMLVTHAYMYFDETIYDWAAKGASQSWNPHAYGVASQPGETVNDGQELWDKLVSKHSNFRLTFNGHVLGDGTGYRSTVGENGNVVHQMLANYQFKAQGGFGDMRLLEFKEDGETVVVKTYSPVLDRHDRTFDQEFAFNLNELRGPLVPPPPPFLPAVVAGNLRVTGPTDPTANTVDSVTFAQSSSPKLSTLQVNRGDFQLAYDGAGLKHQEGVLLASVRQNQREGYEATVEVGRSSFGDGVLALSVMEMGVASDNELNVDTAAAWFQFQSGWQAAHVNGNGALAPGASHRVESGDVTRNATGRYRVDLDVNPVTDGLLFAVGGNNDNVVVLTSPTADGAWDVRVQDNATNFAATGADRDWAFVYVPYDTEHLVGGLYDGRRSAAVSSVGGHTLTRLATGRYELAVTGATPTDGVLLLTVAGETSGGGVFGPDDNALTYEATADNKFLIEARDLPAGALQDTQFAWAFVSFATPLQPTLSPADFDRNGFVNSADLELWRSEYGSTGTLRSDGNGDGVVNAADYTVWRDAGEVDPRSRSVPEPHSGTVALVVVVSAASWSRRTSAT